VSSVLRDDGGQQSRERGRPTAEQVGAVKTRWTTKKLGDVCVTIQDGAHESPKNQFDTATEGRFLYITSKNIRTNYLDLADVTYVERDFHDRIYPRCQPRVGDVLLTKDGANTGNVALNTIDQPFSLLSSVCLIKTDPTALSPAFLCYYLQSPDGLKSITGQMTGAAIKRIILRDIKLATIPLPSIPEQQRIVGILDEAFGGIATAKANAEKNLQNARAIFESHLQSVFARRGAGWVETPLGEMCERITKGSSPRWQGIAYVEKPGILFITSENVGEYQVLLDHPKYVEETFNVKDRKSILKRGDVLTNIVGASIGRTAVFGRDDVANINQAVCLIRGKAGRLYAFYLMYLLNSPFFKQVLHDNEVDNARANLSLGFFSNLVVPTPPVVEQRQIVTALDSLRAETRRLDSICRQKLAALDALKKCLLRQAFTGQL
jgi:type I restriction enzyme, S subunit